MSRLKLYWPDQDTTDLSGPAARDCEISNEDPFIIPFRPERFGHSNPSQTADSMMSVLTRAQVIRENQECPACGHPVVEPIELNDASISHSGLPIPGTATLVGFRCCRCDREWSA